MKVETRLIIGLVSAVLVFLYEWLFKNTLDWYPSIVHLPWSISSLPMFSLVLFSLEIEESKTRKIKMILKNNHKKTPFNQNS